MTIKSLGEKLCAAFEVIGGPVLWSECDPDRKAHLERVGLAFCASLSHDDTATATIEALTARAIAAEQARDEAREALKPFAAVDMVNHGDAALIGIMRGVTSRNMATWSAHGLTVGDFRRAAKIINPAKEG